jgi:hypothetical protein
MTDTSVMDEEISENGSNNESYEDPPSKYDWMKNVEYPKAMFDVPRTNEAFAEFIMRQATVDAAFVLLIRDEGGIYSFDSFLTAFNEQIPTIIEMFGTELMAHSRTGIDVMSAINLAHFLKTCDIIDDAGIPDYAYFNKNHQSAWCSYRTQHRRSIKTHFQKALKRLLHEEAKDNKDYESVGSPSLSSKPRKDSERTDSSSRRDHDFRWYFQKKAFKKLRHKEAQDKRYFEKGLKKLRHEEAQDNKDYESARTKSTKPREAGARTNEFGSFVPAHPAPRDFMTRAHDDELHAMTTKKERLIERQGADHQWKPSDHQDDQAAITTMDNVVYQVTNAPPNDDDNNTEKSLGVDNTDPPLLDPSALGPAFLANQNMQPEGTVKAEPIGHRLPSIRDEPCKRTESSCTMTIKTDIKTEPPKDPPTASAPQPRAARPKSSIAMPTLGDEQPYQRTEVIAAFHNIVSDIKWDDKRKSFPDLKERFNNFPTG